MKKNTNLLLLLCSALLVLCSCHKDEKIEDDPGFLPEYEWIGVMFDGGEISNVSLSCLEPVKNYSDMKLEVLCNTAQYIGRDQNNKEEYNGVLGMEMDYILEKTSFLTDEYWKFRENGRILAWSFFYSAYVNGTVAITCDKTLYGQQPGENLTSHFRVAQALGCLPVGRENPQILYNFGERIPERMDSVFVDGAWMLRSYALNFIGEPQERYDELTLTLHFPITKEHIYEYVLWKYRGKDEPMRVTDENFTSDCTIKFDWK